MIYRALMIGAGLFAAAPVFAEAPDAKGTRDAKNWDVLHQMYPARAILAREEGLVGFKVRIDAAGSATECTVTHTSGHPLLDQETCQLIMKHATFKRPEGVSLSQERSYEGVVNWKLPTTSKSAPVASPQRIAAGAGPEKVICKRIPKTGTLSAFERTCLTESEWKKATDQSREHWDELQGRKGMTNGN